MKKVLSKRILAILVLSILSVSFFAAFATPVFAQDIEFTTEGAAESGKAAGTWVANVFHGLLNPIYGAESAWGTRALLAVLLFLVIFYTIPFIIGKDHKLIGFLITLVVTALAIIAIPEEFYNAIITQYGAMGATILSVIPFAIIFMVSVLVQNLIIARVIWLFYVVYYFSLYLFLLSNVFIEQGKWVLVSTKIPESIPYIGAIIVGLIMFFYIVKIREMVFQGQMEGLKEAGEHVIERGGLLHELQKEELEGSYGPH